MNDAIKEIVVVGGGTAGWLTAATIAAEHKANSERGVNVTLVESPEIQTVGVGEGTWPTIRSSLQRIGISETDLFRDCDASFKQGSKFQGWTTGGGSDSYYHPFSLPHGYVKANLSGYWQGLGGNTSFVDAVSSQGRLCDAGLAPKQLATPEYAAVVNYAYHLDAVKLAQLLQKHSTTILGVRHVLDHTIGVNSADDGYISSVTTKTHGDIKGDLFIDCTGVRSVLLGEHYNIPFIDKKNILFNDRALAVHVNYPSQDSPIASHTLSTAHSAGWLWDIGLPTRRGVGCVYSSSHMSDEEAEKTLRYYLTLTTNSFDANSIAPRKLQIKPGYHEKFWHKNCVAVGMSAGFIEPLEASAIALIELASAMISDELPINRAAMEIVAKRFNRRFVYRWERIVDFLKLHYCISQRSDSVYWLDNRDLESIPERLIELLELWRHQPPSHYDLPEQEEIFPSASYQYILYGMGFKTLARSTDRKFDDVKVGAQEFEANRLLTQKFLAALPSNRELIDKIKKFGLQKI